MLQDFFFCFLKGESIYVALRLDVERLTANEKNKKEIYIIILYKYIFLNIYIKKWFVSKAPMAKVNS